MNSTLAKVEIRISVHLTATAVMNCEIRRMLMLRLLISPAVESQSHPYPLLDLPTPGSELSSRYIAHRYHEYPHRGVNPYYYPFTTCEILGDGYYIFDIVVGWIMEAFIS
jgi:hypothetical protein